MRVAWLLWALLLIGCLEPRVCRADLECPFDSICEIAVGQDAGVCRRLGPPDAG